MSEQRWFQWIHGDERGNILFFDHIETEDDNNYIVFKDKSRINENFVAPLNQQDLTGKLMAEIDHPNNFWKFHEEVVGEQQEVWELNAEQERVCVQPYIPGKKIMRAIPPRPSAPRTSSFGVIHIPPPPPVIIEVEKFKTNIDLQNDPVCIMMSKSKKIDSEIEMSLIISMPSKNLYDVAKESFENGANKVVDFVVSNIKIEEIKKALKTAIIQMYENPNKDI